MHADSSICHLRDAENLLTATRLDDPTPAGTETPDDNPSSPLFRVFVQLADGSREQAVFASALVAGAAMQPARGDVARRDGETRRNLSFADLHGVWAAGVKAASARRGAEAGRRTPVAELYCLRAIGIGSGGEQELRVRVRGVVGQGDARGRL